MQVFRDASSMRHYSRGQRAALRRIAFVPTMGALHAGHVELLRHAHSCADVVVLSVFVNPLQFNVRTDFEHYPRDVAADIARAAEAGATAVYAPAVDGMYPPGFDTSVHVDRAASPLEGAGRPGHFDGVATVVAKLFHAVEPDVAVFGRKDYQQLAVVQRMTRDLDMGIEIIGVDTVREADGLALSSRNVRLTPEQRASAPAIHAALTEARMSLNRDIGPDTVREMFTTRLSAVPGAKVEYVSVADAVTLEELSDVTGPAVVSCAVWFGDVRLIDNVTVP